MMCDRKKLFVTFSLIIKVIYTVADFNFDINIVRIKNGLIAGNLRGNYIAFEGIPYAEPPIGQNRFEPPQPYTTHWQGIRSAKKVGSACLQWNYFKIGNDKVDGAEDCLFLNVYKPKKWYTNKDDDFKFPVIVHVHGGGFQFSDGSSAGPKFLMEHGRFVYVSFNYRLGPLGFLSTNSRVIPGNMGLKDQVLVLKWVKENIASFSGDPNSVTLTGFSAGAASVHLHYMSPLSQGLFHRGISHSGNALGASVFTKKPLNKTLSLAKQLNCSHSSQYEMIKCLKSKSGAEIVRTIPSFVTVLGSTIGEPMQTFAVVKEGKDANAFITDMPVKYLKRGEIQKLPWLASVTKDEGVFFTADMYADKYIARFEQNWYDFLPLLLDYNTTSSSIKNRVSKILKDDYFGGDALTKDNFSQLIKVSAVCQFLVLPDRKCKNRSFSVKARF
jgi:carboxylesterase type B